MRRLAPPPVLPQSALATLALVIGAGVAPFGGCKLPTEPYEMTIASEWAIAQNTLAAWTHREASGVHYIEFTFDESPAAFQCGGVLANGCFYRSRRHITWNVRTPHVLRHEAMHAILWKLDDPRWRCVEHTKECTP